MKIQSGTVSNIVWHFTGGPKWNDGNKKQENEIKTNIEALNILEKIIDEKQLKLGSYKEVIKTILPYTFSFIPKEADSKDGWLKVDQNVPQVFETASVCCLAEIPIQHLQYHSQRYGKCAVGFYRDAIISNGFSPVTYMLINSKNNTNMYEIMIQMETLNFIVQDVLAEKERLNKNINNTNNDDIEARILEIDGLNLVYKKLEERIKESLCFIKVFGQNEFDSVYCEREWRSIQMYNFSYDDIAMIIVPKEDDAYSRFISQSNIPRRIPIIPWEDLLEN